MFQLPEPWSGRLDIAPLLFVSSNPSINEHEAYPDNSWEESKITEFFQERFSIGAGWVSSGRALLRNGKRSRAVQFWGHVRNRAREILQRQIDPGMDFAMTEVVHCKSLEERGVREAQQFCSDRYLQRVISASAARVLIIYGKTAEISIRRCFASGIAMREHGLSVLSIGGKLRMLAFLPHPSAFGPGKTISGKYGDEGLGLIQAHLKL